eukprot:15475798-Alexandrium_andersonii.AAC.4
MSSREAHVLTSLEECDLQCAIARAMQAMLVGVALEQCRLEREQACSCVFVWAHVSKNGVQGQGSI